MIALRIFTVIMIFLLLSSCDMSNNNEFSVEFEVDKIDLVDRLVDDEKKDELYYSVIQRLKEEFPNNEGKIIGAFATYMEDCCMEERIDPKTYLSINTSSDLDFRATIYSYIASQIIKIRSKLVRRFEELDLSVDIVRISNFEFKLYADTTIKIETVERIITTEGNLSIHIVRNDNDLLQVFRRIDIQMRRSIKEDLIDKKPDSIQTPGHPFTSMFITVFDENNDNTIITFDESKFYHGHYDLSIEKDSVNNLQGVLLRPEVLSFIPEGCKIVLDSSSFWFEKKSSQYRLFCMEKKPYLNCNSFGSVYSSKDLIFDDHKVYFWPNDDEYNKLYELCRKKEDIYIAILIDDMIMRVWDITIPFYFDTGKIVFARMQDETAAEALATILKSGPLGARLIIKSVAFE